MQPSYALPNFFECMFYSIYSEIMNFHWISIIAFDQQPGISIMFLSLATALIQLNIFASIFLKEENCIFAINL